MSLQATHDLGSNESRGDTVTNAPKALSTLLQSVLREPLVHFFVLGALIFGIDAALHPPGNDDKTILVTRALRQSFINGYDEDKQRVPTADEVAKFVDNWVASEILYREGKALGVDRGDSTIHDRIIYKLQLLMNDQVEVPKPTDQDLRQWFDANHARFDEPERVSFFITPPSDEPTARRRLDDIKAQREDDALQKQTLVVLARPISSLAPSFGNEFGDRLLATTPGEWSVIQSREGWHVVRLDGRKPGNLATFEDKKDEVRKIWVSDETRKRAWDAVNRLKAGYKVKYEP